MHFSTIAFALFGAAASASAFSLVARQDLPGCVQTCAMQADLDGCNPTDTKCLCDSAKFVASTTTCVFATCQGADLQTALDASKSNCLKVGVTLTSTPAVSSTSAPASSSSGASVSANATGTSPANSTATNPSTSASNTAAPATSSPSSANTAHANTLFGALVAGLVALAL